MDPIAERCCAKCTSQYVLVSCEPAALRIVLSYPIVNVCNRESNASRVKEGCRALRAVINSLPTAMDVQYTVTTTRRQLSNSDGACIPYLGTDNPRCR